jgi:cytochrome oxidase Cu insertion factor (SCO1/SenC/PrrC family)
MSAMAMSVSHAAFRSTAVRAPKARGSITTTTRAFFGGKAPALAAGTVHDFVVNDIDGKSVSLKKFAGKAVLIVNVASA